MTTREWLDPRLDAAPPELAGAIRHLLRESGVGERPGRLPVDEELTAAALRGLDAVARADVGPGPRARQTALQLLAADAVLTYAFEAAADLGADVVDLARRLGPRGALGTRLAASPGDGEVR